ncbi:MAG: hypothetical protein K0B11_21500 [Mariniphaga sp.]|nr:hypothetical protein [Mariniphaga sp.]
MKTDLLIPITDTAQISSLNSGEKMDLIEYYDGLGRLIQLNQVSATPTYLDIVQHIEYDSVGRQTFDFLPIPVNSGGGFQSGARDLTLNYYNAPEDITIPTTPYPFGEKEFDGSPLNRVMKQGYPGATWQLENHPGRFDYSTNIHSDLVRLFDYDEQTQQFSTSKNYKTSSLYVYVNIDENGNTSRIFKDNSGRVVLREADLSGARLRTYYIYDIYGNLAVVIQPEGSNTISLPFTSNQNFIKTYCFTYRYDSRHRLVEKLIPGANNPVFFVYDSLDRVVLTQDGNLRENKEWYFSKYDVLSRPVMEGIYSDQTHASRSAMQTHADDYIHSHSYYETKDNSNYTEQHGYSDEAFPPIDSCKILKVYYYDTYDLNADGQPDYEYRQIPPSFADLNYWDNPRGLTTAVKVKILGDRVMPDPWLITVNFYDNRVRVIQQLVKNHYGNYDTISSKYNFAGDLLLSRYAHNGTHIVCDSMVYDHYRRLIETYTRVNGQSEFLAVSHEYNELGQLIEKNLHGGQGSPSFLQSIDYSYNIRGWLTGINKRDNGNDTDDAFFQELFYDDVASVSDFNCNAQYNGNIAATLWKNSKNGTQKGYGYTYDALNRLKAASYGERSGGAWNFGKYKVPEINYDYNGNITKLVRYGFCGQSYTCIDSLNYYYYDTGSNRLMGIIELADRYCGFRAVNTMPAYYYDANGNMNMDKNKGIEAIVYNHLNLPAKIELENNKRIYYLYDAAGTKLRKYYYEDSRLMTTTDYSGPFVYTGHRPDYILTAEGRLKWDDHDSLFHPEYFIKDHLGNVRVVLTTNPNQHHLSQITDYYPFGMEIPVSGNSDNQLKYNGKELQMEAKLEWYDYGARFYDPVIGRFHVQDAYAEKYFNFTPYQYGANSPARYIDVNGDSLWISYAGDQILYENGNLYNSDGSEYTGAGVKKDKEGNVKRDKDGSAKLKYGFLSQTVDALNTTGSTESGGVWLEELQSSSNHFTIKTAFLSDNPEGYGINNFKKTPGALSHQKAYASQLGEYGLPGGTGGTIWWNPQGTSLLTTAGPQTNSRTDLAHELIGHGLDANRGTMNSEVINGLNRNEWQACYRENIIRNSLGLPMRTYYRLKDGTAIRILDANNNPILP